MTTCIVGSLVAPSGLAAVQTLGAALQVPHPNAVFGLETQQPPTVLLSAFSTLCLGAFQAAAAFGLSMDSVCVCVYVCV